MNVAGVTWSFPWSLAIAIVSIIFIIALFGLIYGANCLFLFAMSRNGVPKKVLKEDAKNNGWQKYMPLIEEGSRWFMEKQPTPMDLISEDGLHLKGYLLTREDAKRTVICVHGFHGAGIKDFGAIAKFYYEHQCNVLLFDQRAHGESQGRFICYGVKERYDLLGWIRKVNETVGPDLPIYLDGVSMGGATVLMATELELPSNVVGIVADCGFTSPHDIFVHILKNNVRIPKYPILFFANIICRIRAGVWFKEADTLRALQKNEIPVLFIHGDIDDFVPTEMTEQNYEACKGKKELVLVEGAGHALSYYTDQEGVKQKIMEFMQMD